MKYISACALTLTLAISGFCLFPSVAQAQNKQIFGWVEKVRLYPADIVIHAKIDSGADYSSLSASNIEKFERGSSKWVRFTIKNRYGHKAVIEKKIVRTARIKRHNADPVERYVIRLGLCMGETYMEEEVNLADRSQFDYQMLIGRSFLSGNVLIDPSSQFTIEPSCGNDSEDEDDSKKKALSDEEDDSSEALPHQFNRGRPKLDLTKPDKGKKEIAAKPESEDLTGHGLDNDE
jgi:hypothetical protein